MFRERATDQFDSQRSAVNLAVPDSKFHLSTGRKTDIPKLFMVDASFEGGGEGKKIGLTPARESFYGANETESRSRETRSTSRKRRGKVYANLVARVSRQAKSVSGHASPPSNG